jgi:diguanylate cyclase (GGDEF)-like protein
MDPMPRKSDRPVAFIPKDDPAAAIMAALLPVHAALTPGWLADATASAAEQAFGVPFTFVYAEGEDGALTMEAPASDQRRQSLRKALDALGEAVLSSRIEPATLPVLSEALDNGSPLMAPLADFFAPALEAAAAGRASAALGIDTACMAPLETAGERLGALIALGGPTMNPHHLRLLAEHAACASINLRNSGAVREAEPDIGIARAVFDGRKLESELARELQRSIRYKREVSICVIEATNLRLLRERFGRGLTERLLDALGSSLARQSREIDVIGAYKESGYTMVLTEASAAGAESASRRLRAHVEDLSLDDGAPGLELHLAAGWATCPQDGLTPEELFSAAERRMYAQAA